MMIQEEEEIEEEEEEVKDMIEDNMNKLIRNASLKVAKPPNQKGQFKNDVEDEKVYDQASHNIN